MSIRCNVGDCFILHSGSSYGFRTPFRSEHVGVGFDDKGRSLSCVFGASIIWSDWLILNQSGYISTSDVKAPKCEKECHHDGINGYLLKFYEGYRSSRIEYDPPSGVVDYESFKMDYGIHTESVCSSISLYKDDSAADPFVRVLSNVMPITKDGRLLKPYHYHTHWANSERPSEYTDYDIDGIVLQKDYTYDLLDQISTARKKIGFSSSTLFKFAIRTVDYTSDYYWGELPENQWRRTISVTYISDQYFGITSYGALRLGVVVHTTSDGYKRHSESWEEKYYFLAPVKGGEFSDLRGLMRKLRRLPLLLARRYQTALARNGLFEQHKPRLVSVALDSLRYISVNSAAYIHDLVKIKESITPFVKLVKRPKSAKNWANAWLSYRYGLRLTILDTIDIVEGLKELVYSGPRRIRSRFSESLDSRTSVALHLKYNLSDRPPSWIESFARALRSVDLLPSLANIYDFIPYSFVVDWFVEVQPYLEAIDQWLDIKLFDIRSCVYSVKLTHALYDEEITNILGDFLSQLKCICYELHFIGYRRWVDLSQSPTFPSIQTLSGLSVVHAVDSAAMIVQRKRP